MNPFRRILQSDRTTFGLWVGLCDSIAAEICACAGFDWLLLDGEHAPYDARQILSCLQAVAAHDCAPVVRPLSDDRALLKQMLDVGAQSLLVPMVDDAGQAAHIVQSVRYPPRGVRGVGPTLARAARWGRVDDYVAAADAEICLVLQVESREGLSNLPAIVGLAGVDAVFLGPADLSAALGFPGQAGHPRVTEAICDALGTIRSAGKPAGVFATDGSLVERYVGAGASFVAVGSDTGLLAKETAALARRHVKAGKGT